MDVDFEPYTAHAERYAHIALAVDHEFLIQDMQHLLVGRDRDRLGGFDHALDVLLGDLAILDRHHAARIDALDMAAGDTGIDVADLAVGHQFGLFQRALDRVDRRLDVDDHAFLESLRRMAAHADDLEAAVRLHFGDDRRDLRRADVETDDQILVFLGLAHQPLLVFLPPPRYCSSGSGFSSGMRTANPFG